MRRFKQFVGRAFVALGLFAFLTPTIARAQYYVCAPFVAAAPVAVAQVPVQSYYAPSVSYSAPVPVTSYYASAPVVAYSAPVAQYYGPVTSYYPATPVVTYAAPAAAYVAPVRYSFYQAPVVTPAYSYSTSYYVRPGLFRPRVYGATTYYGPVVTPAYYGPAYYTPRYYRY